MARTELDDALYRFAAAEAGVVVVDVDCTGPAASAPAPPRQAFEVVRRLAGHGAAGGRDGARLTAGARLILRGRGSGGGPAGGRPRQALEPGGLRIALRVLHSGHSSIARHARDEPGQ
jgi:acetyl esterase